MFSWKGNSDMFFLLFNKFVLYGRYFMVEMKGKFVPWKRMRFCVLQLSLFKNERLSTRLSEDEVTVHRYQFPGKPAGWSNLSWQQATRPTGSRERLQQTSLGGCIHREMWRHEPGAMAPSRAEVRGTTQCSRDLLNLRCFWHFAWFNNALQHSEHVNKPDAEN